MVKRPRKKIFLALAFLSFVALCIFIYAFPPTMQLSLGFVSLPILLFAFLCLFLFLYSLTAYLFRSFIHGILVGLFPIVYLFMRLQDLKSPLFLVLLAGIFVALEILLVQLTKDPNKVKHT